MFSQSPSLGEWRKLRKIVVSLHLRNKDIGPENSNDQGFPMIPKKVKHAFGHQ